MQDLWIFHPLGHSSKQDVMAYVVKVALKVYVNDLGKPLHQPIFYGGNSEPAGLAIPLRNLHPPVLTWLVGPGEKFLLYPFEKLLHSSGLDGLKAYSIKTRCPIVGFCLLIGHP